MNSNEFRAELVKIMPGYSWTVHKQPKYRNIPQCDLPLIATGIQSSGSNRLSTLEITRRERDGEVTYTARLNQGVGGVFTGDPCGVGQVSRLRASGASVSPARSSCE